MLNTSNFYDGNVIYNGLERQISLVAIKVTLSNFQNPRWQPSDLDFGKIYLDGLENRLIPLFMDYQGLQNHY